MKLQRVLKGKKVLVQIGSGVSHIFISTKLVDELSLEVESTPSYTVCLRDEHRKNIVACCKNLSLQ